ncbi:MAG: DinB family protein [Candidatus Eiseniibacteriota bacterium]|jgi:hypothetical protein
MSADATTALLAKQFTFSQLVIDRNTDGMTQADSLIRPQPGGNCVNWILGHILVHRNAIHRLVGAGPAVGETESASYQRGAPPLPADGAGALEIATLLEHLRQSHQTLLQRLEALVPDALARQVEGPTGGQETVAIALALLQFHESYHAGQLGILRRLTGKEGALR